MKTNKKIKLQKRKTYLISVSFLLILVFAIITFLYVLKPNSIFSPSETNTPQSGIDYNPPTQEQINAGNNIKDVKTSNGESTGKTPDLNNPNNTEISIPSVSHIGSTLRVTTLIQRLSSTGHCTMTLSQLGSTSVVQTVDVQANASSSTCKGFSVPTDGMSGQWLLDIKYTDDNYQGNASLSINI